MSCLRFNKRKLLLPAKKVWNNFTTKLHRHKRSSKSINSTTTRLNMAFSKILGRPPQPSPYVRRKTHSLTRPPSDHHNLSFHHHTRSLAPVYVDKLFNEPVATSVHVKNGEALKIIEPLVMRCKATCEKGAPSGRVDNALESAAAAAADELVGVDLRAEMFIAKFREEMRLQRQRSFGEYQEMLARGA